MIERWLNNAQYDKLLRRYSYGLDATIVIACDDDAWALKTNDLTFFRCNPTLEEGDIVIKAGVSAWNKVFSEGGSIIPGYQGFTAIERNEQEFDVRYDDLIKAQSLAFLERLFEIPRVEKYNDEPNFQYDFSGISGSYVEISIGDCEKSLVYYERSGSGTPVLMLHTAGADSRQYKYQLSCNKILRGFELFAFDLPGHGRSECSTHFYEEVEYKLTQDHYRDWCVNFIEKVIGEPVIVVGCSMGAAMSLVLAADRPDLVCGVVALGAPWKSRGRKTKALADPRVSNSLHNSAYVRALMSPSSPKRYRDEACWIYSQSSFGIYPGDLHFYSNEFDGEKVALRLKESEIPIRLLTGSYDYSASPDDSRKIADIVRSSRFVEIKEIGHFPMMENPSLFNEYLFDSLVEVSKEKGLDRDVRQG